MIGRRRKVVAIHQDLVTRHGFHGEVRERTARHPKAALRSSAEALRRDRDRSGLGRGEVDCRDRWCPTPSSAGAMLRLVARLQPHIGRNVDLVDEDVGAAR